MPRQPWESEGVDEDMAAALGRAIASRRGELGLKRNDLRDRSGLSYPYIAELENGTKRASSKALAAIAAALELSVSELLARAESISAYGTASPAPDAMTTLARAVPPPAASPVVAAAAVAPIRRARSWFASDAAPPAPAAEKAEELPLTEERVREIVREELRAAGVLPKGRTRRTGR